MAHNAVAPGGSADKIRAFLGAVGIGADIVENPVERLSGGQKARLLMAMATIDTHIMILDEPTNHLDIESRQALVHALNDYQGAVILVSHDPHLVETVADTLGSCVMAGSTCSMVIWTTTSAYCSHNVAANRPRQAMVLTSSYHDQTSKARGCSMRERRQDTKQLRMAVSKCEREMTDLQTRKDRLQSMMAGPGFYDSKSAEEIAEIGQEMANIIETLASAEEVWLEAQEALEQALGQ